MNRFSIGLLFLLIWGLFWTANPKNVCASDAGNLRIQALSALVEPSAGQLRPTGVWTDAEAFKTSEKSFGAERLIDGDPATISILLDSSRTGSRDQTVPPRGNLPVTAKLVFDFGQEVEISGMELVTWKDWKTLGPKRVTASACSDAQGTRDVRPLATDVELLRMNYGGRVFVTWPKTKTRFVALEVLDSWQIRDIRQALAEENQFDLRLAEVRGIASVPVDSILKNAHETAFPEARLVEDWLQQDCGPNPADCQSCFTSENACAREEAVLKKVLADCEKLSRNAVLPAPLKAEELAAKTARFTAETRALADAKVSGSDVRWKALYLSACQLRRTLRLARILEDANQIIYVKHHVFGGTEGLSINPMTTDRQFRGFNPEVRVGSQLCRLTLQPDGTLQHEVLIEKPLGIIRDPNLSYDAQTLYFAMRESLTDDDFHLFAMELATGSIRQITFTPEKDGRKYPCSDVEPCCVPTGELVFTSTRNCQINDCWPEENTNLFICRPDGSGMRRLTYDELAIYGPQVLEDGRVIFSRWEYSDRNAYFLHPLFTMNCDGTMQTEYVGNNSMFPASYLQARSIPGSTKVLAIISGHHTPSMGKLALVDRNLGTQNGDCIEFVAGSAPDGTPGRKKNDIRPTGFHDRSVDYFGQSGCRFQYPFALDETHYLTSFTPTGWPSMRGPYFPPFGLYFMTADGERELLAFDWWISCSQPIAVKARPVPAVKPSQVNPQSNFGTFVVQNIYVGPGLKGVPFGTVKKIRVVALEYRAGWLGTGPNAGESDQGYVQTPISLNNGSWDVKHVLGEVSVESDGSAAFQVPARTPVYFQMLDEKGYCVQTMRSWSTLQPGEVFACLGCHENKLETGGLGQSHPIPLALKKAPQQLQPFAGRPHPLVVRLQKESALDSVENYLGVNAPSLDLSPDAPADGFSYPQQIQPIWNRHCVSCHTGDASNPDPKKASRLALTGEKVEIDIRNPEILAPWYFKRVEQENYNGLRTPLYVDWKRDFTRSLVELTHYGKVKGNSCMEWLETRSRSEMLPPYHTGSCKSRLMKFLEPDHYGVQVSENEKRTVACWIDLLIPFCGSYSDANTWTDEEKAIYRYHLEKRRFFAEQEMEEVKAETGSR